MPTNSRLAANESRPSMTYVVRRWVRAEMAGGLEESRGIRSSIGSGIIGGYRYSHNRVQNGRARLRPSRLRGTHLPARDPGSQGEPAARTEARPPVVVA